MNADTTVRPELSAFLTRVRAELADLGDEQRDELLDGLEADLAEQLAAGDALPDPAAYAAELRAAAGLTAPSRWGGPGHLLDRARAAALRLPGRHPLAQQAWELLVAIRPAWWVLRAWIAVSLIDPSVWWRQEHLQAWPDPGFGPLGRLVLPVAVVISVLIGQDKLWPGSGPRRSTLARVVLLGLNVLAVLAPLSFPGDGSDLDYYRAAPYRAVMAPDVLHHGDQVVSNIYAYDASGQPVTGIQLFDQDGQPVSVSPRSATGTGAKRLVTCPAFNGAQELWNVFPLPEASKRTLRCGPSEWAVATRQPPPLATVPAVTAP